MLDLTQIEAATEEQKRQGLVEWARAFRAKSWEEVKCIENSGVKEAAKTMQVIMSNPTERDMIRMRQDAQSDRRTELNAARRAGERQGEKRGKVEMAKILKREGVDPAIIVKSSGLTLEEIAAL